ncbi:hypothetical protein GCM10011579_057990 [Streptomyces albiflavescens]|uniref:Uncharacterized protein n=1 Tax=Streptomyces albiflavescens TaxID=1623582 RepID=A0A917YA61_9ACTN|nr:hypothetical protein [Streptomyces albiflavescens]GGN76653.1 hypothetical protein GCM10011579_057990 [Streptomyces albiflavescens]
MITHSDDGPDFEPDDPLAVILRPSSDYLGPPAGRYETIRRAAARRRLLRTAVGVGLSCAVAALVALPFHLAATSEAPGSPTVPLAPAPASGPSLAPTPSASPEPVSPRPSSSGTQSTPRRPTARTRTDSPGAPTRTTVPTRAPSATPTPAPR